MSDVKKNVQYVNANGTLTLQGMLLFLSILERLDTLDGGAP